MRNNTRGSITMMAYAAMLFISLFGAILLGNAMRKYKVQTDAIATITNAYDFQMSDQELYRLYDNAGATRIALERGE